LGRLRVQRELTEIREADLCFTVEEAGVFLNELMALALSGQDVADLEARTEGWIAGLQLAALALQDRPDRTDRVAALTGSHRYLIDYLGWMLFPDLGLGVSFIFGYGELIFMIWLLIWGGKKELSLNA
jgi:ATP/maltotriose-dependent transcriptional regulator MalT